VKNLQEEGFLLPDVGAVNWGDLRRPQPLCQFFGFMRGTPIDRYYLDQFIKSIQKEVSGITLEIGGEKTNQELYGFKLTTEYRVLDLPGWSDDIVGDATNPEAVSDNSFDSIIIFNVLEHCENPQAVVDNIYKWLKPGGRAFAMVPCTQRIHPTPRDYWRPMPDGLQVLFKAFHEKKVTTYGNITTVIASFHGIAVEELTTAEMDFTHPDYPVVACIVAQK
jgi:SAM-dependent methyltransferase